MCWLDGTFRKKASMERLLLQHRMKAFQKETFTVSLMENKTERVVMVVTERKSEVKKNACGD